MEDVFRKQLKWILDSQLKDLEEKFDADVVTYIWEIRQEYLKVYRDFIEELGKEAKHKRLVIILKTPWGSAETAEKMVEINRKFYDEVYFVVPDFAMSAWTILCMSGDKIYMDYSSSLWPIDPQVLNRERNQFVPALWYLDKVENLLQKAQDWSISQAEFLILKDQDLWMLNFYEQAKELSISLLKEWLVKYKFKDWVEHRTHSPWASVTDEEKKTRAEEIAKMLGDNKLWHSHWRFIGIDTLRNTIQLEIEDFYQDPELHLLIREYNDTISTPAGGQNIFLHSRLFF